MDIHFVKYLKKDHLINLFKLLIVSMSQGLQITKHLIKISENIPQ